MFVVACLFMFLLNYSSGRELKCSARIIGGSYAPETFARYQATLIHRNKVFCAGAILNNKNILTSKTCVFLKPLIDVEVLIGTVVLSEGAIRHKPTGAIVHMNEIYNIGILKVGWIEYDYKVSRIPLTKEVVKPGKELWLTGWGKSMEGPIDVNTPYRLQRLNATAISNYDCLDRMPDLYLDDYNMCVLTNTCDDKPKSGACGKGDLGTPLIEVLEDKSQRLVGLIDWLHPVCGSGKDVYLRIFSFRNWIKKNITS